MTFKAKPVVVEAFQYVRLGDYVVREPDGELRVWEPNVFQKYFETIEE